MPDRLASPASDPPVDVDDAPDPARPRGRSNLNAVRYLGKRLGHYALTAVIALIMNFFLPRLMPGDPVQDMIQRLYQQEGRPPPGYLVENIRTLYGDRDQPLLLEFWNYLVELAHFEFGLSIMRYPTPVTDLIAQTLPWTVGLAMLTISLAWVIGTLLGSWLGWKPSGLADSAFTPILMFFHSIPAFWLALVAAWFFAYRNAYFPAQGGFDPDIEVRSLSNPEFVQSVLVYGTLPALVLITVGFAGWLFGMRNVMITVASEDYVTLARAKGLPKLTIMLRYAARNAMLPNVTGLAQAIGGIFGSIVLVEAAFVYPGMGSLLGGAINERDYPLMQAILLMTILVTLVANFLADSLYVLLDPRTREQEA